VAYVLGHPVYASLPTRFTADNPGTTEFDKVKNSNANAMLMQC